MKLMIILYFSGKNYGLGAFLLSGLQFSGIDGINLVFNSLSGMGLTSIIQNNSLLINYIL